MVYYIDDIDPLAKAAGRTGFWNCGNVAVDMDNRRLFWADPGQDRRGSPGSYQYGPVIHVYQLA